MICFRFILVFELDNALTGCGDDTGISVSAQMYSSLPHLYHPKLGILLSTYAYTHHVA